MGSWGSANPSYARGQQRCKYDLHGQTPPTESRLSFSLNPAGPAFGNAFLLTRLCPLENPPRAVLRFCVLIKPTTTVTDVVPARAQHELQILSEGVFQGGASQGIRPADQLSLPQLLTRCTETRAEP
jgi:hypothetical protein